MAKKTGLIRKLSLGWLVVLLLASLLGESLCLKSIAATDLDGFTFTEFTDGGDETASDRILGNITNTDLDFITDGTSRIKIEGTGNVGIGTNNPNLPLEVNGAIKSVEATNTTAAVINVDWALGNQQTVILNQSNHTINFTNVFPGQIFRFIVCQDGSGSRTIGTWSNNVRFPGGASNVTLSSNANTCDVISFITTDAAGIPGATIILGTIVRGFDAS